MFFYSILFSLSAAEQCACLADYPLTGLTLPAPDRPAGDLSHSDQDHWSSCALVLKSFWNPCPCQLSFFPLKNTSGAEKHCSPAVQDGRECDCMLGKRQTMHFLRGFCV